MFTPNPQSEARSLVSTGVSNARSKIQGNPSISSLLLYLLGTIAVFTLIGLGAAYSPLAYKLTFALVQVAALLLGLAHLEAAERWLPWYDPKELVHGASMAVIGLLAAGFGVALASWLPRLTPPGSSLDYVLAVIPFVLPYFLRQAWRTWQGVPAAEFKLWYYRPNAPAPDLSRMDLNQFMVVHFWMSRRYGEALYHDFSSKAPYEMRFGDLFHIFLSDYNVLKPDQALQYLDEQGRPYGWLFYAKTPWWKRRRYYDPDHTFRDNFLTQGSIIVARRVAPAD
jgi:hypothetical protein